MPTLVASTVDNSLPQEAFAKDGCRYYPRDDAWKISGAGTAHWIHFEPIRKVVGSQLLDSLKRTTMWYAQNYSGAHVKGMNSALLNFVKNLDGLSKESVDEITERELINFKTQLGQTGEPELGKLRILLKGMARLQYPGLTRDALRALNQWRLKGNEKGVAVKIHCSQDGPLTDIELNALISGINEAFSNGEISLDLFVASWLFLLFGIRPVQLVRMKLGDIVSSSVADGSLKTILMVPRAKQQSANPRGAFKARELTPDTARLIVSQKEAVLTRYESRVKDWRNLPLFPAKRENESDALANGYEFHTTVDAITSRLDSFWNQVEAYSERTGELIHVTPMRLRRTLGTRAAEAGMSPLVIAEMLDHSDTQNAMVYIESRPKMVERIDAALAEHLAPLANAFLGVVIPAPEKTKSSKSERNQIADVRFDESMKPFATCTEMGACSLDAPIACYVCSRFQPWLDGPHQKVLEFLIVERNKHLDAGRKDIAKANDRVILAVAQVVQFCKKANENSNG